MSLKSRPDLSSNLPAVYLRKRMQQWCGRCRWGQDRGREHGQCNALEEAPRHPVEDVEGGSWEGLEPAKWLVSLSDWIVLKMFFRSKCLKLTLMVSPQPPPGWCHRSSHLCRCQSWWWWRTHPPPKMPLEVPSQQIASWVLQAGKSFRVGKDL